MAKRQFYKYEEMAEILNCSVKTITRLLAKFNVPIVIQGGLRRVEDKDFDEMVLSMKVRAH